MILQLSTEEVDLICSTLSRRPWMKVNPLLQKILSQANDGSLQQSSIVPPKAPKPPKEKPREPTNSRSDP